DRLGNLGVIDDKYDVAISTACCVIFILSNELPTMDNAPEFELSKLEMGASACANRILYTEKRVAELWQKKIDDTRRMGQLRIQIDHLTQEGDEEQEFQIYTEDELDAMDKDIEIDDLKNIQNVNPNLNVLEDYRIREKVYLSRVRDLEDITIV
ncbi:5141_t:CDS:2, partial [Funneliformis caledonium]